MYPTHKTPVVSFITFIAVILAFTTNSLAAAEPVENTVFNISRNAQSAADVSGQLSKNIYRTETYDAPYTEQVPYEDTETYTEQVPYDVQVPYTEYVTDYRQEYVCHSVTKYREQCHNEVQCYLIPGTPQCHDVEECGTNVNGDRICKTRTVCEGGSSEQRCEDHQVCTNEPYTDNECGYEQVAYQKEVTSYRTETQYRTETRTRTVTKYRDEQRCCRPETRSVFDHQLTYQVNVHFPQSAQLSGSETEQLSILLISADADSAVVSLKTDGSIFGYVIAKQELSGAIIRIELAVVPKYDSNNAGKNSISSIMLSRQNASGKLQLNFTDKIRSPRLVSQYKVSLFDDKSAKLEEKIPTALQNAAYVVVFDNAGGSNAKLNVVIDVTRSGPIVKDGTLKFQTMIQTGK